MCHRSIAQSPRSIPVPARLWRRRPSHPRAPSVVATRPLQRSVSLHRRTRRCSQPAPFHRTRQQRLRGRIARVPTHRAVPSPSSARVFIPGYTPPFVVAAAQVRHRRQVHLRLRARDDLLAHLEKRETRRAHERDGVPYDLYGRHHLVVQLRRRINEQRVPQHHQHLVRHASQFLDDTEPRHAGDDRERHQAEKHPRVVLHDDQVLLLHHVALKHEAQQRQGERAGRGGEIYTLPERVPLVS